MKFDTLLFRRLRVLVASAGFLAASNAIAQSVAAPESLQWRIPSTLPISARVATLRGDPAAPAEATLLISMPNGYEIGPHFHPGPLHVEVREGTLLIGMGDTLDPKRARSLTAGDSITVAAGMHHFWIAKGRTIASMSFMGPFTITYLRSEDAPRRKVFPFGY